MDKFANLAAFVAVVETGSFSKAARRLGIGKSIVSRRVSALESSLGVQLLRRTTRSLSLTAPGHQFHEHAVRILGELDEAEQAVSDSSTELRGRLRLAGPLSFGLHHLNAALADFLERHPGIEVDLDLNDREVNLVEEGLDMTVRIGELRDSTLLARRLGSVRFVTCASPAYLQQHGTPLDPDALRGHVGLLYSNIAPSQAWQFRINSKDTAVVIPGIRLRANNGDALAAMAVAGLGIVNLPSFIVSDKIVSGELTPILTDYRRSAVGMHAVFPPGRLMTRKVRAFADFLAERFGDLPAWDRVIRLRD